MKDYLFLTLTLALAAGVSVGCDDYSKKKTEEASAIAADTSVPDKEAVRNAAKKCVPLSKKTGVAETKGGGLAVILMPETLGLTQARSMDTVKANMKRELARHALCVFRATEGRPVETVGMQQVMKTAEGKWHTTYAVTLERDGLEKVAKWKRDPMGDKRKWAQQDLVVAQFKIVKEDLDGFVVQ